IASIGGISGVDVPAETPRPAIRRNQTRACHFRDRQRTKNANTAIPTAIQDHLAIDSQVVCRGEESRVPCDPTHPIRRWVVDFAAQPALTFRAFILRSVAEVTHLAPSLFRGRNASAEFRLGTKARFTHAQRR